LFAIKKGIAKDLPIQATKIEHILIQSIKKTAIVLNKNIKGGSDGLGSDLFYFFFNSY
jgi:hypothetical protein